MAIQMQMQMIDGSSGWVAHVVPDVVARRSMCFVADVEEIAGQLIQPCFLL